jgi:hypothetical protein
VIKRSSQSGLTLTGLLFTGMLIVLVAALGMKVVPEVIEYTKIVKDIKAVSQDPSLRQASASDVRMSYQRHAIVDQITAITQQDIDISRNGDRLVLSFAYTKKIPLFGPVSLLIDFEASTDK